MTDQEVLKTRVDLIDDGLNLLAVQTKEQIDSSIAMERAKVETQVNELKMWLFFSTSFGVCGFIAGIVALITH